MNAVIYCRYSSSSQDEQTIEVQKKACYDFALKKGYTIIEEYVDEAKSGRSDNRPAFKRLLKDSENGNFNFVIVYKLDRFARNIRLSLNSEAELQGRGIITLSTCESNTNDAQGKLMRGMNYLLAEFYSNDYAQRITSGLENCASKFQATGGQRVLGLKTVDKKYEINDSEALIVKRIFEQYDKGESMAEIIRYCNANGFKTSKGGEFNKNSINRILTNKRYIGFYIFKDTETPNIIPKIIDDKLYWRVQDRMKTNKKAPARARAKTSYLLTTKLFCGSCKEMMVGISGTSRNGSLHTYYSCKNVKPKTCNKTNVKKDFIEDLIINELRTLLTIDGNIKIISEQVMKVYRDSQDASNLERLKKSQKENSKRKNNLVLAVAECDDENMRKTFFTKITDLDKESSILEKEIYKENSKVLDLTPSKIRFFLKKLGTRKIDNLKYRKLLVNSLINSIYLYDNKVEILVNTQDKPIKIDIDDINNGNGGSHKGTQSPPKRQYPYPIYVFKGGFTVIIPLKETRK